MMFIIINVICVVVLTLTVGSSFNAHHARVSNIIG